MDSEPDAMPCDNAMGTATAILNHGGNTLWYKVHAIHVDTDWDLANVLVAPKAPVSSAVVNKKAAASKGTAVTRTV